MDMRKITSIKALNRPEEKLAISLGTTKRELAHAECFDDEQRAEYLQSRNLESDGNAICESWGNGSGGTLTGANPDA